MGEIVTHPDGDVTIKVVEYDHSVSPNADGEFPVLKIAYFKVIRQVLRDSSSVLKTLLKIDGPWKESVENTVILHDDTITSVELWFRHAHGTITDEMFQISIEEIWHAIEVGRKYLFKLEDLNGWFTKWWDHEHKKHTDPVKVSGDITVVRQLLYPCHEFDHAAGFALVSSLMVYLGIGHLTEDNPTHHRHLHLRHTVVRGLHRL